MNETLLPKARHQPKEDIDLEELRATMSHYVGVERNRGRAGQDGSADH